jgi:hypothetical protein
MDVLKELLRVRMRVVYGVQVIYDEESGRVLSMERSESAAQAAKSFASESRKIGYMNLLPRNAFVLDLRLFVETFMLQEGLWHAHPHSNRLPPQSQPTRWAWVLRALPRCNKLR